MVWKKTNIKHVNCFNVHVLVMVLRMAMNDVKQGKEMHVECSMEYEEVKDERMKTIQCCTGEECDEKIPA